MNRFFLVNDRFGETVMQYTPEETAEMFNAEQQVFLAAGKTIMRGTASWTDMVAATRKVQQQSPRDRHYVGRARRATV